MSDYPAPTPKPCRDCPWRRVGHRPGWLGPYTAEAWIEIAHGESAVACHLTIKETQTDDRGEEVGMWDHPAMRQCRGMAMFRANAGKDPRHPEIVSGPQSDLVFESDEEFLAYHTEGKVLVCGVCRNRVVYVPGSDDRSPYWRHMKQSEQDRCEALKTSRRVWIVDPDDWRLAI